MVDNIDRKINKHVMQLMENLRLFEESTRSSMHNLTPQEIHTIALIGVMDFPRMSQLAARGHVTRGAVTVMINKLAKKGYVKKVRDGKDRRVVHVTLTPKGESVEREHKRYHAKTNKRLLAELTKTEKLEIEKLLRKLAAALS